jgi:protease IV
MNAVRFFSVLCFTIISCVLADTARADEPFVVTGDPSRARLGTLENPALADDATALWVNPAGLGFRDSGTGFFSRSFRGDDTYTNLFLSGGAGAFGWQRTSLAGTSARVNRWTLGLGGGSRRYGTYLGAAATLVDPDGLGTRRDFQYAVGVLLRPTDWISIGGVARQLDAPQQYAPSLEAGIAIRPMRSGMITLFGGYVRSLKTDSIPSNDTWNGGVRVNLGPGLVLGAAVNDKKTVTASLQLVLGGATIGVGGNRAESGDRGPQFATVQFSSNARPTMFEQKGRIAQITLRGQIRDTGPDFILFGGARQTALSGIITQISRAAEDPAVGGLYLRLRGMSIGHGMADELRRALVDFREQSGKPIVCHMVYGRTVDYYIASVADSIFIQPMSELAITGYSYNPIFVRRTLEKLGIKAQMVRVGKYKSATEVFSDTTLSPANREQLSALMDDWYSTLVTSVAKSREISGDSVKTLIDSAPYTSSDAVKVGLVDDERLNENAFASIRRMVKQKNRLGGSRINMATRKPYIDSWGPRPKIAVVFASGTILMGSGGSDFITGSKSVGAERMSRLLKRIQKNHEIAAVVLRIDSPGGSSTASDQILTAVEKLRETGKPVVVSVGDLAASGGYYIACSADSIFTNPGSIVGSIGIFSGKMNVKGLLHKIGVDTDTLHRGKNAGMYSPFTSLSPKQLKHLQKNIEQGYDVFVKRVADGRGMSVPEVDSLGQGRIYSGSRGVGVRLMDTTGGLRDAVRAAMELAGVRNRAEIVTFPNQRSVLEVMREQGVSSVVNGTIWFYDPVVDGAR